MVGISSSEQVVCDISADAGVAIAPLGIGLEAVNLAHDLLVIDYESRVGEALDVVVAASPLPIRSPAYAARAGSIDIGALRPRRR